MFVASYLPHYITDETCYVITAFSDKFTAIHTCDILLSLNIKVEACVEVSCSL